MTLSDFLSTAIKTMRAQGFEIDLPSDLHAEFGVPDPFAALGSPREIELWSELERLNG